MMMGGRSAWETTLPELETLWTVDVLGVWHTATAAVPHMLAGPDPTGCRFVAIASAAGSRGLFHLAGYTAAKHAVVGLVRGLAADLVGTGVTAVAVSPGATRTAMLDATARLYGLDDPAELADQQLTRRLHEPAEVAATIAHCCSVAGGLLNGSVVDVGGGTG
ncbi:short-chain dehydrogenase/reductase SDR [Nocardioides sp. CF8]|nr:short-chain dehydrogenase/reductase SDR [Nocardioides sp. CF8]